MHISVSVTISVMVLIQRWMQECSWYMVILITDLITGATLGLASMETLWWLEDNFHVFQVVFTNDRYAVSHSVNSQNIERVSRIQLSSNLMERYIYVSRHKDQPQLQKRTKEKLTHQLVVQVIVLQIQKTDDKCFLCERPVGYECLHNAFTYIMMLMQYTTNSIIVCSTYFRKI